MGIFIIDLAHFNFAHNFPSNILVWLTFLLGSLVCLSKDLNYANANMITLTKFMLIELTDEFYIRSYVAS